MSKAKAFRGQLYGRPNTVKTKLSMFNNHIAPFSTIISEPEAIISACMKSWKEDELSLGTIKGCFVVLGEYMKFTYGIELDKKRLMFQHFQDTSRPQTKIKAWSREQAAKIINMPIASTVPELDLDHMMRIHLFTGMRKGELLGLIWADIDFLNGVIHIQRSKDLATGSIGPTKTGKFRTLPMNKEVETILLTRYNIGVSELTPVFPSRDLNPFLKALCRLVKIPVITTHGLRHTAATSLLEKGISPKTISALLGHDKVSTTLDVYWAYIPKEKDLEDMYV